ncbi:MAG: hypothetical protein ACKO2F_11155 [Cyanobacteriota bacterium]
MAELDLEAQLREAREEAELTLEQLHLVQEELEVYFLRCEELEGRQRDLPRAREAATGGYPFQRILIILDRLGPQPHLQAIRLRLRLGLWPAALAALDALIAAPDLPLSLQQQARLLLSDVRLRQAELNAAEVQLAIVRDQLREPAEDLELNRQLRIATTLRWLAQLGTDTLPSGRVIHNGLAAALDRAAISPCGTWISLSGWLIDTASALQGLALLHNGQVLPLQLSAASRRPRSDLGDLLTGADLPADAPIGFTLDLWLAPEQARPRPDATAPVVLLLLLPNGEQVCIATAATPTPLDADLARSLLPADFGDADHTHLWALPPWS